MRALTLSQPWATLVAFGEKRVETRSWRTHYQGPLAIHAAKGYGPIIRNFAGLCLAVDTEPFATVLKLHCSGYTTEEIAQDIRASCGSIIATCRLGPIIRTETFTEYTLPEIERTYGPFGRHELAFGDYTPFRWAWMLRQITNHHDGEECVGGRGLWTVPADVEHALMERGAPE